MIIARGANPPPVIMMAEETNPRELERGREQDQRFERNYTWFKEHAREIYAAYEGRSIVVAGQEVFAGSDPSEALAAAVLAHPEDDGRFGLFIPRQPGPQAEQRLHRHAG